MARGKDGKGFPQKPKDQVIPVKPATESEKGNGGR